MGDGPEVGGWFTLRYGDDARTYRADDATVTTVRHPGGVALAVRVGTQLETHGFGVSAEYPGAPSVAVVVDAADGVPPSGAVPMLYLYDMHLINRVTVTVTGDAAVRRVSLRGTAGGFAFEADVAARFGGATAFDPAPRRGWWVGHYEPRPAEWPAGEPCTEAVWRRTDQFRRLCRAVVPHRRPPPPEPPVGRLTAFARRVGLLAPPPAPPAVVASPSQVPATPRQLQFLLAALVEYYLADCRPDGSPDEFREAARVIERFAGGTATAADRARTAFPVGRTVLRGAELLLAGYSADAARDLLTFANLDADELPQVFPQQLFPGECRGGCDRLRCVFGNPFRPVAFDPAWRTAAAVGVARAAHDTRDFAALPVLADALEEAGCADAQVLAHCREPVPHVRGCWVVNALLT